MQDNSAVHNERGREEGREERRGGKKVREKKGGEESVEGIASTYHLLH